MIFAPHVKIETMKKYILFILIVSALFYSSGQTYEEQSLIPTLEHWLPNKPFNNFLSMFQIPYWGGIVSIDERGYYLFIEFLIRKGAHVFTFGALAISTFIMTKRYFLSLFITLVIAVIDEFHQSFTGGRTPTFQDVLLDAHGAIFALLTIFVLKYVHSHKKSRLYQQT